MLVPGLQKNKDLNIFYVGGSGGFLFLHLLLLTGRYWCSLHSLNLEEEALRAILKNNSVTDFVLNNVKLPEADYSSARPTPLSFNDYVAADNAEILLMYPNLREMTLNAVYNPCIKQLILSKFASTHMAAMLPYVIDRQWSDTYVKWKHNEIQVDNDATFDQKLPSGVNKIFFTCNDINKWESLPGEKVVIWTDSRSLLRLCLFKSAGYFVRHMVNKQIDVAKVIKEVLLNSQSYENNLVTAETANAIKKCSAAVKLQDLFSYNNFNIQQQKLLTQWLQLHPPKLLKKLGIKND